MVVLEQPLASVHHELDLVTTPAGERRLAVNLAPAESDTAPMPMELLEKLGAGDTGPRPAPVAAREAAAASAHNVGLESQQKLWRWIILALLLVLGQLLRARRAGGTLSITRRKPRGTTVTLELPHGA